MALPRKPKRAELPPVGTAAQGAAWAAAGAGMGVSVGVEAARAAAYGALQGGGTVAVAQGAAEGAAVAAGVAPSAAEAVAQRAVLAAAQALGVAVDAAEAAILAVAGTMTHVPVPSSNIESAAYDPSTGEMEIRFTKYDRLYRYYGVSPVGWAAFWAAPSKGRYARDVMPGHGGPRAVPGGLYEYEHVE